MEVLTLEEGVGTLESIVMTVPLGAGGGGHFSGGGGGGGGSGCGGRDGGRGGTASTKVTLHIYI